MSDPAQGEHFDLTCFVLDYLAQTGGIVAPVTYGAYEILLPDDVAASLGVDV